MNQTRHQHTNNIFKQQMQQLNQMIKECPPPPALQGILNIMTSCSLICSETLPGLVDRTCDQFLKLNNNSVVIANLGKEEQIQSVINKFLAYSHHQQLEITNDNEPAMKKYRNVISHYFHEIIHNVTSRSLVKLSVLFYKLLSLQMLDATIVNYFLLMLIVSYEKLTSNRELKIIKSFLRSLYQRQIIYIGIKAEANPNKKKKGVKKIPLNYHLYESTVQYNNCFTVLTYLIYFGNMSHKSSEDLIQFDKQMLQKLFAFPMQISSLILAFRNQYPQSLILSCDRNLRSLSECIVDSTLLKSLLRIYLDFKFDVVAKNNLYMVIQNLVKFSLTLQTVKNMIKVLEISDSENLEEKWKKMFMVLKMTLPPLPEEIITKEQIKTEIKPESPTKFREDLSWQSPEKSITPQKNANKLKKDMDVLILAKESFLKFNFQHEFNGFMLSFNSYRTCGQFILTKLINQEQEIWVIIRHLGSNQFHIQAMTMSQNNVSINKVQVTWDPFETHTMLCSVRANEICFQFSQGQATDIESQSGLSTAKVNVKNIKPKLIQIGTLDNSIPCYFSEIHSFDIFYCQGKNSLNYIKHQKNKLRQNSKKVYILTKNSLLEILKKLGDLDLFFLLVSHLVRKVDDQSALKMMLKEVIDFLELLVVVKGVQGVKLTDEMKQHRFYNVRCLVWLASKHKRDPDSILEIFRLLEIRGIKRPLQCLQILSNIGLWKQIPEKNHYKLLQKIKDACHQLNTESSTQILETMKKIILDYMIFYRNNQLLSENLQNQYLLKHSQILKLVFDMVASQSVFAVLGFIQFLLKILYLLLDRTKNSDFIDTCIGFQIALLTYRLLMTARQVQYKANRDKSKTVTKKSQKMTKPSGGLSSMKSLNILVSTYNNKDDEPFVVKIEETISWAGEILYCLKNQILYAEEKIKYYDWQWDQKQNDNSSSYTQKKGFVNQKKKQKVVEEPEILRLCEKISMGLLSYDRNVFNLFNLYQFSGTKCEIFWEMNLFNEKTSFQRFVDTIKFGHFETIPWTDQKIVFVIQKSFDLTQNSTAVNLPEKFLESMKAKDVNLIHNSLLGIYYDKCQQDNSVQKQKCSQKIMYILSILPDSLYSNTQLLRQELRKQKRNAKVVDLVEKHLIIKQLAKEGFKLMKQMKTPENKQLTSTIVAFDTNASERMEKVENQHKENLNVSEETQEVESKRSKNRKDSEDIAVFSQLQNLDYQESFWSVTESQNQNFQSISSDKIKQSLEYLRLLANPSEMQTFYKVSGNKKQARQQIQGHIANFNLNIDAIIKIFEQNEENKSNKLSQLQSYIFFIQKHLYAFSKMIMSEFLFKDTKQVKVEEELFKSKRKKSFQTASNFKFKQVAETMLEQFLRNRRRSVYKMENVWYTVQKNNKDFWEIFFKPERKNQSVDLACNSMKLRGLIKVDQQKREIQLPKNMTISNKFSISGDSQKDDPHICQQSLLFEDSNLYQHESGSQSDRQQGQKHPTNLKQRAYNEHMAKKKQRRENEFQVSYITTTAIYQGLIFCENNTIKFWENLIPNSNFYGLICANQNQQRTTFQIQKKRQKLQITLNQKSTIIPKRYLYHDAAVQIFSEKRTYFFLFGKGSQREQFLRMHAHLRGTIQNQSQLIQAAQRQMERWINGDISNYTYLMHLNDLSGRTFNDMSQYYIFPWVLTNYKAQKFNKKFLANTNNYRDLSKPIGAINPKRFDELETRYKQSTKYQQNQPYLYGSFCSNPAIVCNFMVRLEPFSMHHYLLQSSQFDLPDRIFYSVANQFNCCYTNVGDYKELIPEFYSCPEFLRNRNKYKFGEKQNKQSVNNVELPEWALYEFKNKKSKSLQEKSDAFLPEEQFVFRMRKCLQSDYVTKNINYWIDLIFGLYNRKEKAIERSNLYIHHIYKNELKKSGNKKDLVLIYFKQFGQIPRDLFERDHKSYRNSRVYYRLRDSQSHLVTEMEHKQGQIKKYYADFRFFISWTQHIIHIMDIKNKTGLLDRTENSVTQIPLKNQQINSIKIITTEIETEQSKKLDLLIYLKSGRLRVREMSISTFRKKLEVKEEKQDFFSIDTQFRLMEIYQEQKFLIFTYHNSIKIYQYALQANASEKSGDSMFGSSRLQMFTNPSDQSLKFFINKKLELKLTKKYQFTQHRSQVEHICVCQSYGLLISIDSNRKAYILKINSKQIEAIQYFKLKKLTNCQNITHVQIHQMGYIITLTSLNNIHVYNFMGDYVAGFKGSLLKDINSKMQKKIESATQPSSKNQFNSDIPNQSTRKKSANDIATEKIASCEFEESDPESSMIPSIIIEEGSQKKYQSSTPLQKQQKQKRNSSQCLEEQVITSFKIWNHESLELIIGTNFGCVYRIDLYMIEDCEKIDFNNATFVKKKEKIRQKLGKNFEKQNDHESSVDFISVNRIGRHWQSWVASGLGLFKMESEDYRNADKRHEQYKKKSVIE